MEKKRLLWEFNEGRWSESVNEKVQKSVENARFQPVDSNSLQAETRFSSFFFFSFFSSSFFFSFFFFLFFLFGVHQLVFASGLNADLNTKRETAILLRPWGLNNSTIVRDVYSCTGWSDRNETILIPLKEIFVRVLIGYKLIRARFLKLVRVYVCVWKT